MKVVDFIVEIFEIPAIILGLVALIGLAIQRKSGTQIFAGTLKTALGLLIISAGATTLVLAIIPFVTLFGVKFNLDGFGTSSEGITGLMQSVPIIGSSSAVILALGFLVNVLLARFTPLKYIFLTGHHLWMSSVLVAYCMYEIGWSKPVIIIVGSLVQGILLTLLPSISQPLVRKVTGNDDFAIAHLTTLGTVSAGWLGGLVGNKDKSTEDMKLPKGLTFFKDTAVAISVVMGFFYLLMVLIAGPDMTAEYGGSGNYILFGIVQALTFTAGVLILLQGVRMFLGELVPAFKGISDKLVPNAIPAVDVPMLFGFAPNALMIGFIASTAGMLVAMPVSSGVFGVVPLVSIIGAFFTGGVAGIFGNATGGRVGAIVAGFFYGFILIFLSALTWKVFDGFADLENVEGVGHDCVDAMATMLAFKIPAIGFIVLIGAFVGMSFLQVRRRKFVAEAAAAADVAA
ncbi:MAG: PTS ascorbate transporter subunit IIC [Micrococcales bacterium]|nr:PTS ascorbate transporter subunit IIC [Micrococcales bacterium]